MDPRDIFEYKQRWKPNGHIVHVHSDLDVQCKQWCRRHLERWEWSMDTYTDVYSHTFYFEHDIHAKEFAREFFEWVNKGRT